MTPIIAHPSEVGLQDVADAQPSGGSHHRAPLRS